VGEATSLVCRSNPTHKKSLYDSDPDKLQGAYRLKSWGWVSVLKIQLNRLVYFG